MFSSKTIAFLRKLKKNNDRAWFHAHRDEYERHVRAPMVEIVDRLAQDLRGFAPELVADPRVSLFRPWRDTRFSEDKTREIVSPFRPPSFLKAAALMMASNSRWFVAMCSRMACSCPLSGA